MQSKSVSVGSEPFRALALLFLGPPASGKSERAKRVSQKLGYGEHIEVSDLLRKTKDSEILGIIKAGELVPDNKVNRLLVDEIRNRGNRSVVICGSSRKEAQAEYLLHHLNSQRRRTVIIDGDRPYNECQALHMLRQINEAREDDASADLAHRFMKYYANIEGVRRHFRNHLFPQAVHRVNFTDDIEGDCMRILSMIQPHCESFSLPETVGSLAAYGLNA